MATKKKLLQAAAGSAGSAVALNVEDVFSTYLYEGNGSAQVIENGINLGQSYGSGSTNFTNPDEGYPIQLDGTISLTGDFTVEAFVNIDTVSSNNVILGSDYGGTGTNNQFGINASSGYLFTYSDPTFRESTTAVSVGTWQHVAISRSGSTIYFWVDGVAAGTGTDSNTFSLTCIGALEGYTGTNASFEGYMSNVRVSNNARYTSAFTAPTSDLADDANTLLLALQSTDPFTDQSGTYTLTADSSVKSSTFGPFDAADAGEGGAVIFKSRTTLEDWHTYDTERGTGKRIALNTTTQQYTGSSTYGLTSFNSSGFSVGSTGAVNNNGSDLASWTFRKAPKFFDVVTYTGDGTDGRTISHNLDGTVGTIIARRTDSTGYWRTWHRSQTGKYANLYDAGAFATDSASNGVFNNYAGSDTTFTVGINLNASGGTYVAYLFAHNDGDGTFGPTGDQDIIKCGSYTNSSSGIEVDLGFEPQWLLVKKSSATGNWSIIDNMRGWENTGVAGDNSSQLRPNLSNVENREYHPTITSTGFKTYGEGGGGGSSVGTFIYIAIRRGPMAGPTAGTDVFAVDQQNASDPYYTSNFPVDFGFIKTTAQTGSWYTYSRLQQGRELVLNTTAAETAATNAQFDYMDGFYSGAYASDVYSWMWKRAPNYFDVVAYTGNSTSGRTVSHNLGVAPEMIWVKNRDEVKNWIVYHKDLNGGTTPENYDLHLNDTNSETTSLSSWNNTAPTSTEFTVGNSTTVNSSGYNHIAYLFASVDGVSKVGSYTGTGAAQNIDCGFSSGARFVLIKRTDSSGYGWMVLDTERGIVAGNDPRLQLNTTDAEVSNADVIDPYSGGFALTSTGTSFNASGGSYIFYAIA